MRTPVIVVAGQGDAADVVDELCRAPGTVLVEHRFDGHVVRRRTVLGAGDAAEAALELAHGDVSCTIRNDLVVYLRLLHRRDDVSRIVVHLAPWLEPELVCWDLNHVRVRVGPGYIDGPAVRDVGIAGVVTCIEASNWLPQALGYQELPDGRTVAEVAVGQVEFADVLVLNRVDPMLLAVCRRLSPRAEILSAGEAVDVALAQLRPDARRGSNDDPHGSLLAGQPNLGSAGPVQIVEFGARRPFHPQRLHDAVDQLLDGVVRTRGRLWLANRPDHVMWLESAGGGLRVSNAGHWITAMPPGELAHLNHERKAFADLMWDNNFGDRHTSMTVLVCGARPEEVLAVLDSALLTDDEFARREAWAYYPDPFGDWHEEPCGTGHDALRGPNTDRGSA